MPYSPSAQAPAPTAHTEPRSPKQGQRSVDRPKGDHSEYLAMLRRMLKAGARRLAAADPEDLVEMVELTAALDAAIVQAVAGLRSRGTSWADIGAPLGLTKQGAQQRYARKVAQLAVELEGLP